MPVPMTEEPLDIAKGGNFVAGGEMLVIFHVSISFDVFGYLSFWISTARVSII